MALHPFRYLISSLKRTMSLFTEMEAKLQYVKNDLFALSYFPLGGLCISNAFLLSVSSLRLRADVRHSDVWYCNKRARAVLTGTKQESSFAKHTLTFKIDFEKELTASHFPCYGWVTALSGAFCTIKFHLMIKIPLMQCSTYFTRLGGRNLCPFYHFRIVLYVTPASRQKGQ